jgi:hypothetical protein
LPHLFLWVCEGEFFLLLWFFNELNRLIEEQLSSWRHLIVLVRVLLFFRWGFQVPTVRVLKFKLIFVSRCQTWFLGFMGVVLFVYELCDQVLTGFPSIFFLFHPSMLNWLGIELFKWADVLDFTNYESKRLTEV